MQKGQTQEKTVDLFEWLIAKLKAAYEAQSEAYLVGEDAPLVITPHATPCPCQNCPHRSTQDYARSSGTGGFGFGIWPFLL